MLINWVTKTQQKLQTKEYLCFKRWAECTLGLFIVMNGCSSLLNVAVIEFWSVVQCPLLQCLFLSLHRLKISRLLVTNTSLWDWILKSIGQQNGFNGVCCQPSIHHPGPDWEVGNYGEELAVSDPAWLAVLPQQGRHGQHPVSSFCYGPSSQKRRSLPGTRQGFRGTLMGSDAQSITYFTVRLNVSVQCEWCTANVTKVRRSCQNGTFTFQNIHLLLFCSLLQNKTKKSCRIISGNISRATGRRTTELCHRTLCDASGLYDPDIANRSASSVCFLNLYGEMTFEVGAQANASCRRLDHRGKCFHGFTYTKGNQQFWLLFTGRSPAGRDR